jgi:hypothetical protein
MKVRRPAPPHAFSTTWRTLPKQRVRAHGLELLDASIEVNEVASGHIDSVVSAWG